ncbi:hypothetical protein Ddc_18278 [Ditylenchus destructor]|nr:hypothetical protein Ddc_18278 [Ditylenchus destructor]
MDKGIQGNHCYAGTSNSKWNTGVGVTPTRNENGTGTHFHVMPYVSRNFRGIGGTEGRAYAASVLVPTPLSQRQYTCLSTYAQLYMQFSVQF